MTEVPASARELFGLPLEGFTNARNELADRLKAEGAEEEAKRVRKLKKPGVAAWAVNQLSRQCGELLRELFRLRDEIEGADKAARLRSLTEERRKLLTKLVGEARKILADGGHAPAASTIERVSQTLLAASDEEEIDSILSGTLVADLTSSSASFGAFGSVDAAVVTFDPEPAAPDPKVEKLRAETEAAEALVRDLEDEVSEAERNLEAARDRLAEAEQRAEEARRRLDDAET